MANRRGLVVFTSLLPFYPQNYRSRRIAEKHADSGGFNINTFSFISFAEKLLFTEHTYSGSKLPPF